MNLRERSLEGLNKIGFDGLAIGGLSVGEPKHEMIKVLDYLPAMMPADKPRYLMGVGKPEDLVEGVRRGVDMFDCLCVAGADSVVAQLTELFKGVAGIGD